MCTDEAGIGDAMVDENFKLQSNGGYWLAAVRPLISRFERDSVMHQRYLSRPHVTVE